MFGYSSSFLPCLANNVTNKLSGGGGPPMQPYPPQPYPPSAAPYVAPAPGAPEGSVYTIKTYTESAF